MVESRSLIWALSCRSQNIIFRYIVMYNGTKKDFTIDESGRNRHAFLAVETWKGREKLLYLEPNLLNNLFSCPSLENVIVIQKHHLKKVTLM